MFGFAKYKKSKNTDETAVSNILSKNSIFAVNEAYKAARTNIMFSINGAESGNVIACTSAMPGEGKTTTCTNLAISFAQTESKVILIDADLRKPKVETYLDCTLDKGLSDYLGGFEEDLDSVIAHIDEKNIDCIFAGRIPPNPAELLGSAQMDILLEQLKKRYDYIFIDTPPVNIVTDATVLSQKCTGTIVIVRENHTTHDMFRNALESLRFSDSKIVGVIVNRTQRRGNTKYSKFKYSRRPYGAYGAYQYGYGYIYGDNEESYAKASEKVKADKKETDKSKKEEEKSEK